MHLWYIERLTCPSYHTVLCQRRNNLSDANPIASDGSSPAIFSDLSENPGISLFLALCCSHVNSQFILYLLLYLCYK